MDTVLRDIRQSYIEMDRFWVDEVWGVSKALKDRRLDPGDIDRWRGFGEDLEQSIAYWKVCVSENCHFSASTYELTDRTP